MSEHGERSQLTETPIAPPNAWPPATTACRRKDRSLYLGNEPGNGSRQQRTITSRMERHYFLAGYAVFCPAQGRTGRSSPPAVPLQRHYRGRSAQGARVARPAARIESFPAGQGTARQSGSAWPRCELLSRVTGQALRPLRDRLVPTVRASDSTSGRPPPPARRFVRQSPDPRWRRIDAEQ